MSDHKKWECSKCGKCCNNLHDTLELLEDEIKYFPKDSFYPYSGFGKIPPSMEVFIYKLISAKCPLYNKDIGCSIYENRPRLCRKFPLSSLNGIAGIDDGCSNALNPSEALSVSNTILKKMYEASWEFDDAFNNMLIKYKPLNEFKLWIYKDSNRWEGYPLNKIPLITKPL